jgi:hypothetical protein
MPPQEGDHEQAHTGADSGGETSVNVGKNHSLLRDR